MSWTILFRHPLHQFAQKSLPSLVQKLTEMAEKKLFLLDAYALAYRAYYAFIKSPRINSKGVNTSAVFGFTNTLLEVLQKENPSHIGVVFDPHGPTFRHQMYAEYKANREAMPEDMRQAIPLIKQVIEALNIPVVQVDGYEADDIIGTLAHKAVTEGFTVYMMTPDKDYAQLVRDGVFVYKPGRSGGDIEIWDAAKVKEKFAVTPDHIVDLLGLMGDSSDNIPGCPGVGPKGAEKLITDFGSIEGVYEHIDELKGKLKENMVEFRSQVELSKVLATINTQSPVEFDADKFKREEPNKTRLETLFAELEFRNMLGRAISQASPTASATAKSNPSPAQGTLFDIGGPVQGSLFDLDNVPVAPPAPKLATIADVKPDYRIAQTADEQAALVSHLLECQEVSFDTETTSLDVHNAELVAMTFTTKASTGWMVPVPANQTEAQAVVDRFKPFFANSGITKIAQNAKYDIAVLKNYGVEVRGRLFDTMVAHYLIQPELRHNLDLLAETYLKYSTIKTEELIGRRGGAQKSMRDVDQNLLRDYACEDADIAFRLKPLLEAELQKSDMIDLFFNIETPLIPVLADMEYTGVMIDTQALNNFAAELRQGIAEIEKKIHEAAGMEFNVSSPKQLGEVLFDRLKIGGSSKTRTQQYSTAEDVLEKLADKHPIVPMILEYRSLKKLLSTYAEALPQMVNPKTGRIHTSYNQTVTATGRLSSTNPNLQNIPIREEVGRMIRRAFVPTAPDGCIMAADYSQIELRLMAHLSQDAAMIEAFRANQDIHAATAARLFHEPVESVTREQRRKAKSANFGIIYGISSFGLAQNTGIKVSEAKEIIDSYFASFPGVKSYMDKSIASARDCGYTETLCHRRRYLPDLQSANSIVKGAAERNAINAPIQGTAADIIKIAMINIHKKIAEAGLKSAMVMQVHDELVFDVAPGETDVLSQIVKTEMESAIKLSIPLTAEVGVGANWLEAH